MRLVYLSPLPWASFAQRPHKFVEWFHNRTGGAVLWVDPYPTRFPNWRDLKRSRPYADTAEESHTPAWLTVLKPRGLPIEPLPGSGWVNGRLWQHQLRQIADFADQSIICLAIGKPSVFALKLLEIQRNCLSLYDAMDDFPAFYSGLSRNALAQRESKIAQRVDVIWASSSELKSRWGHFHSDVRLVHNGLDLSAIQSVERRPISSKKIVFGYVGTIASWFDWSWICSLAEARLNDEIRLIGPVFTQPVGKVPINVKLYPARDHADALKAMTEFHVALIPFKKIALTASVDPIKYYEYRALGLPVISTDFGEMSLRSDERGVFISQSSRDVPALADFAIQYKEDKDKTHEFALNNTWEARFDAAKLLS